MDRKNDVCNLVRIYRLQQALGAALFLIHDTGRHDEAPHLGQRRMDALEIVLDEASNLFENLLPKLEILLGDSRKASKRDLNLYIDES